jgi:PrtD family type I secretion system ABC transporter
MPAQHKRPEEQPTPLQQTLRKLRSGFAAVTVFSFFLNLLMLATPLYMLQIFQRVLSSGHLPTLFYLTLATIFALLILGTLYTIRSWILNRISAWLSASMGSPLISASLTSTLAGTATGAQPLRDLGHIQAFIGGSGITALFDAPWIPVFIAAIWLMHPWLGGLAAASAVALFILAVLNELSTRKPQAEATKGQVKAHQFVDTTLRNSEAVQAMGMLPDVLARWSRLQGGALAQQGTASAWSGTIMGLSRFLRLSVQVAILGLGAMLVLQGELHPGQMIAASILLGRALAPVEQSLAGWRSFVMARSSYAALQQLLHSAPERPAGISLPPPKGRLEVSNVTFKPQTADKPILQRVSFTLEPGMTLGIVGPSAAGKSTLCRLLVGVWPPTLGSVRLDSADVHAWNRTELGRHVGYLPQDVELFAGTIRENIARMGEAADEEVIAAAKLADIHDMVLRLPHGYDTEVAPGGALLSAGQRQRVGLARAFLREPVFIVLDEPNSNLDRVGEAALRRSLATLKERGSTIVLVAHHAGMLEAVDRLLVLREGKVEAFGPRNDVLAHIAGSGRVEGHDPGKVPGMAAPQALNPASS